MFCVQYTAFCKILNTEYQTPNTAIISRMNPTTFLTIGGSDSGGAAGVQADLKTATALGAFGMCALTAVTAQNSAAVHGVEWLSPDFLAAQIDAVLSDYGADGVKTGFLGKVSLLTVAADAISAHQPSVVVIDPVLVNHKQQPMFDDAVRQAYLETLFPLATLATPNVTEAALLLQQPPLATLDAVREAARALHQTGAVYVLVKRFVESYECIDVLYDGADFIELRAPFVKTENTHGSGDTLSAAACIFLSRGMRVETAVAQAKTFTTDAIRRAVRWQLGAGHGPLAHFVQ